MAISILKRLVLERCEEIEVNKKAYGWKDNNTFCTSLIYHDYVTGDNKTMLAYVIPQNKWKSFNAHVEMELDELNSNNNDGIIEKIYNERVYPRVPKSYSIEHFRNDITTLLYLIKKYRKVTHRDMRWVLTLLKRMQGLKSTCDGRLYYVDDNYYYSFWGFKSEIQHYKYQISSTLKHIGIDYKKVFFQSEDHKKNYQFETYDDFFDIKAKEPTKSELEKSRLAKDLHVKKSQLDQSLLNVIADKPKNYDELYAALEKQFKMPIAQIKQKFEGIPLDRLLVRQFQEIVKGYNPVIR